MLLYRGKDDTHIQRLPFNLKGGKCLILRWEDTCNHMTESEHTNVDMIQITATFNVTICTHYARKYY